MLVYLIAVVIAVVILLLLAMLAAPEWVTARGLALERRFSGLTLRHAQVDGFDMPYLEGGKGEPLLLIHGFGGDKDNFTRIARFLTPHYRVIIPDLPGFGDASRNPQASYTIADQVGRLHTLVRQLGIERLHIGGNSMGGFITAQFCAPYGHMVDSLWLLDPSGTAASHDTPVIHEYHKSGKMPLLVEKVEDFAGTISATTHKAPFIPGVARTTMGRRAVRDLQLHRMIIKSVHMESPLLEQAFKPMTTPALIVWGAEDEILNPAAAESFRELFPSSRVIIMPGIGHLPMIESPRQTAQDYLAFREQLARTGGVQ